MTVITIRQMEDKGMGDSPNASLSFDYMGQYPVTISNPFQSEEEEQLEWYFEKYLRFPFVDGVKYQQVPESIKRYGQILFEQLFQDRDAYARYIQARKENLEDLRFEIIGSSDFFHQLHWETLYDPKFGPLVLEVPMVRTTFQRPVEEIQSKESTTINLLIVTARPDKSDVGYRTISGPLVESLRKARIPVKIDIVRPGTYEALEKKLDEHGRGYYHIIHFDLHGGLLAYDQLKQGVQIGKFFFESCYVNMDTLSYTGRKAFLFFETTTLNQARPIDDKKIADLLRRHSIPIAVLNACQSAKLTPDTEASLGSCLMESGVQTVVAMSYSVTVKAATVMMTELYQKLFAGQDIDIALCYARKALNSNNSRSGYYDWEIKLEDWMLPVVYQNGGAKARSALRLREFTDPEEKLYWETQGTLEEAPKTSYGFLGRDRDVLEVERKLLIPGGGYRRNILLIQGMGGSGKSTFLKHLMQWWQTTSFVGLVFYFGYNERAWKASQIMNTLAKKLLGDKFSVFQSLDAAAKRKKLGQKMRSKRHLLVLDNMESITGKSLAIKNTLKPKEREELRDFLAELQGGESLVLLGSRGFEEWLADGIGAPLHKDDVYSLPGLDSQAATTLVERVLERHVSDSKIRDAYHQSKEFQRLIELLDGYPLPIQVVLANLSQKTPEEVLTALKEGGALEDSFSQDSGKDIMLKKTESIISCIDYSYGNLDPGDQGLLMCISPFTSVISRVVIPTYIDLLKQQPVMSKLPFDRWPEVLRQAQNWGLISDDQMKGYLKLHPVLPNFLYARLKQQPEVCGAVEIAYRAFYEAIAAMLSRLMQSNKPSDRLIGQMLVWQEYENLYTALKLSLKAKGSIHRPYLALSLYLDSTYEQERGLELGQTVLADIESYPAEALQGPLGAEMVGVVDNIAKRLAELNRYAEAKEGCEKVLELHEGLTYLDTKTKAVRRAGIYNNLGLMAQEHGYWQQAEQYYKQALEIKIEFDDQLGQARIYNNLGLMAQEQGYWQQAERYYKQALEIYIKFDDRLNQAITYNNLGLMAQEQGCWQQAEQYYKQALEIYIEFDDRLSQARAYGQLGLIAQGQEHGDIAIKNHVIALEIFVEFEDQHNRAIALGCLAKLWQATKNPEILVEVARILSISQEEARKLLEKKG